MNDNHIADERKNPSADCSTCGYLGMNAVAGARCPRCGMRNAAPIAPRADADTAGAKMDEAKGILRLFYEACSACDPETGPYLDTDKLHEAYEALCAKGIQYLRGSNGNWPIATPASSVADTATKKRHETLERICEGITDEMIDGGWTANGIRRYAKSLEEKIAAGASERTDAEKDAARYRWLREQHWNEAQVAVVCDPKKSVKLGFDCPNGQRLDEAIDAAILAANGEKP